MDSAASRMFSDRGDQLAAAASDHQGMGATDVPGHLPPPPPLPDKRVMKSAPAARPTWREAHWRKPCLITRLERAGLTAV